MLAASIVRAMNKTHLSVPETPIEFYRTTGRKNAEDGHLYPVDFMGLFSR
jgi:hypothetical protein